MTDYIPSRNVQISRTTGKHHCIPLTPNFCKLWKIWAMKFDLNKWMHSSNMNLWANTSILICNAIVSSGDEAPTDFNSWQEEDNWELKNSNVPWADSRRLDL